jgi:hypothetical protein
MDGSRGFHPSARHLEIEEADAAAEREAAIS